MSWSMIAMGSALLLVGTGGRYMLPELRFWLRLSCLATTAEHRRRAISESAEQEFQRGLQTLGDLAAQCAGPSPIEAKIRPSRAYFEEGKEISPPRLPAKLIG